MEDYKYEADLLIYGEGKVPYERRTHFLTKVCHIGTKKPSHVYENDFTQMSDEKLSEYLHTTTFKIFNYLKLNRYKYKEHWNIFTKIQSNKYNEGLKEFYRVKDKVPQNYNNLLQELINTGFVTFTHEIKEKEEKQEVDENTKIFFSFGNFFHDYLKQKTKITINLFFEFTDLEDKQYKTKNIFYRDEEGKNMFFD